ncbi:MAG TPA: SDR family oxidoreductase [Methanoregula sp.]|nr:SDR family oxidoreductase [Methanoregula sp.]
MKYIVTGGAGFIGSHIVEQLAAGGHEVVVVDDLFSGKVTNIEPFLQDGKVTFCKGSVTDLPFLMSAFEGADGIFHEGAIASVPRSVKNPVATNEANVTGTLNVLVAARDCGAKKVLFASSSSVYGNTPTLPKREDMKPMPLSPYAVSKLAGEHYLQAFCEVYGLQTIALRYFNVFGPRQDPKSEYAAVIPKFITGCFAKQPLTIFGDGKQTRDFSYVKDVVQANLRAMESSAQGVFNVAYCKRINLNDLAALIMELTGTTVPVNYEPPRQGDVRDSLADITQAQAAFGYAPQYTVRTGLEETVAWYRGRPG